MHEPPNVKRLCVKKTISRDVSSETEEMQLKLYVFKRDEKKCAIFHRRAALSLNGSGPSPQRASRYSTPPGPSRVTTLYNAVIDSSGTSKIELSDNFSSMPSSVAAVPKATQDSPTADGSSRRSSGTGIYRDGAAASPQSQTARPQVQDPVDQAISRLVNQFGYSENDVKWALKITDTGEGINVEAAEMLLRQQRRNPKSSPLVARGEIPSMRNISMYAAIKRQSSTDLGWRWG